MHNYSRPQSIISIITRTLLVTAFAAYLNIPRAWCQTAVSVNWRADRKLNDAQTYQINTWDAVNPATAGSTAYQTALTDWKLGMIRLHAQEIYSSSDTSKCWVDFTTRKWNEQRIVQVLTPLRPKTGQIMLSIPNWPSWMDANNDGKLDNGGTTGSPDRRQEYATFCAELVRIVNVANQFKVKYWEPLNEKEGSYGWGANPDFADIFKRCAVAMKSVDSSIVVGGPALANPWPSSTDEANLKLWISSVKLHLGFFSYHYYGTGSYNPSSDTMYNNASIIGSRATWVRSLLNSQAVPATVPVYLGETNMFSSWTIDQNTRYMRSIFGGNFVALVIKSIGENPDAKAVQFFNDRETTYGFLRRDTTYARRASSHVLQLANQHLVGTSVKTVSGAPDQIQLFAVKSGDRKAVLLVNTSDIALGSGAGLLSGTNHTAAISFAESWRPASSTYTVYTIAEETSDSAKLTSGTGTYTGGTLSVAVPARQIKLISFTDQQDPNRIVRNPEADATVEQRTPTVNSGAAGTLNVYGKTDWNTESYIRFNLSNLGSSIVSAKVRLYPKVVTSGGATHRLDFVTNDSWSESAVTWNTRPSGSGSWIATWTPTSGGIHEIDVTSLAKAALTGDQKLSFRISSASGIDVRYGSKEDYTEFRPELILQR